VSVVYRGLVLKIYYLYEIEITTYILTIYCRIPDGTPVLKHVRALYNSYECILFSALVYYCGECNKMHSMNNIKYGSSVGIVTILWVRQPKNGVSIPCWGERCSILARISTDSGAQPVSSAERKNV
jgi:hypothetical protein